MGMGVGWWNWTASALAIVSAFGFGCGANGSEGNESIEAAAEGLGGGAGSGAGGMCGGMPNAAVYINEIGANEPSGNTAAEFVEVRNPGPSGCIAGVTVSDGLAVRHTFAPGSFLLGGKAVVVFGHPNGIPSGLSNAVAASTGKLSLNNAGDTVTLKRGSSVLNTFTYPATLSDSDGVSMNASPDGANTGVYVKHDTLSSLPSSPGKRINGGSW